MNDIITVLLTGISGLIPKIWPALNIIPFLPFVIFGLIIANAVRKDVQKRISNQHPVFLLGPWLWFWSVLFVGFWAVLGYWLIHYSSFRYSPKNEEKH